MTTKDTKISVTKDNNRDLTILIAKLGMNKRQFLRKLVKVPYGVLKTLLEGIEEVK